MVLAFTALIVLVANSALSSALQLGWARRTLLARLAASFGRPVDVGRFQFNLLSGLRLEADSVTVAEDPRFGQEYFLRAEQLSAGLRWTALFRGRIEFGDVSLTRPSLNLVRLPDGSWNIESWLPPAAPPGPSSKAVPVRAGMPVAPGRVTARLSRLGIDDGRINFKLGNDKLPFALVDVTGYVSQDRSGRWSIDLSADPMRAPVSLQDTGTLRLQGTVAGTSVRLRPASFQLTWVDASLADALRLADGTDHGVRGALSAQFSAAISSSSAQWDLRGAVRLSGVHRWDLGESPLDPAVNLDLAASWRPNEPRLAVSRFLVEAPHSHVSATGSLDWSRGLNPSLQFASSTVGLGDLLAWRRAFLPGIAEYLSVDGAVNVDASVAGWPPHLQQANVSSDGAAIRTQALPGPLRIGPIEAHLRRDALTFGPSVVSLPGVAPKGAARKASEPPAAGELQIEGSLGPMSPGQSPRDWQYRLKISGSTQRAEDVVALAGAFGRPTNTDWSIEGPVALQLAWTGALSQGASSASGTLQLRNLQVRSVALNKPLIVGLATVALKGAERQIRFGALQAFGANWTGTLHRGAAASSWDFDLSADRLDTAGLDQWLGPAGQASLFDRLLPFAATRDSTQARNALFASLAANGRLRIGELLVSQLHIGKLDAQAEIAGRNIALQRAQADFYGGRVTGEFDATLAAAPSYAFRGRVDRVDLGLLSGASNPLASRFAGLAAGELSLTARGIGRRQLATSLEGEGVLRLRNVMLRGVGLGADRPSDRNTERSLARTLAAAAKTSEADSAPESRFNSAAATFHVASGLVRLDQLLLVGRDEQLEVDGTVDFARVANLRARSLPRDAVRPAEIDSQDAEADAWTIGGTLDAPQVRPQTSVAGARPLPSGARR